MISEKVQRLQKADVYDNIYAEVVTTSRFDENVVLSTMYLGRVNMKRKELMKAEDIFSSQNKDLLWVN